MREFEQYLQRQDGVNGLSTHANGTEQKSRLFSHGTTPTRRPEETKHYSFDPVASRAESSKREKEIREKPVFGDELSVIHEVHKRKRFSHEEKT